MHQNEKRQAHLSAAGALRKSLLDPVRDKDLEHLLLEAGRVHGHLCPGLALGVMAAVRAVHHFSQTLGVPLAAIMGADGMEDIVAVIETNNCMADGVQVVCGCTFGNNALIYRDVGKNALSLSARSGGGTRVVVAGDYWKVIDRAVPEYRAAFQEVIVAQEREPEKLRRFKSMSAAASFAVLDEYPDLLSVSEVDVGLPGYARIRESRTCSRCGERVIADKAVERDGKWLCRPCAGVAVPTLAGGGIIVEEQGGAV